MDFDTDRFATPPERKSTRPTRYIGAGIVLLCLFLAAGLLSYNQGEMGWAFLNPENHEAAAEVPCTNWMGVVGLYLAGLLQCALGGGALYGTLLAGFVGCGMLIWPETKRTKQWIAAGCMLLCACAFLDMQDWVLHVWAAQLSLKAPGGYVGYLEGSCIAEALLGQVWAGVLVVIGHAVALVILSRVTAKELGTQAWADSKAILFGLGRLLRRTWHMIRRTPTEPNYKRSDFPEEEEEKDWKTDYNRNTVQPAPQQPGHQMQPQQPMQPQRTAHPMPQRTAQPMPQRAAMPQPAQQPQQLPPRRVPEPRPQERLQEEPNPRPSIQTGPPPLRPYNPPPARQTTPEPAPRRVEREEDVKPRSFEEQIAEADKKLAARTSEQAPPTGRSRRPQTHQNSADNLLDLMKEIEQTIERRNAPDTAREDIPARHEPTHVNPRVLDAMNRHLGRTTDDEEDEDEEKNKVVSVSHPPQVPPRRVNPAPRPTPPAPEPKPAPRPEPKPAPAPRPLPQDTRMHLDDYPLPPYDMLNYVPVAEEDTEAAETEMRETQQCIMDALETFKIQVEPGDITRGPSITRYEFYPPKGLRLNRITNLADNLKLAAQAKSINILAPIPGKNTIGIELENATKAPVYLRELLQSEAFHSPKLRIPVALGKDVYGNPVIGDLAAMPHTLVAGTTGSGKSVCVNSMILSMLYKFRPDELRLILVDPKVVEMQPYKKLPHLACPVVTVASRVIGALRWAVNEMEHRYKLFSKMGVRNFEDFNNRPEDYEPEPDEDEVADEYPPLPEGYDPIEAAVRDIESSQGIEEMGDEEQGEFDFDQDEEIPAKLPYIVIIIDELADLMMQVKEDLENYIARLTQKARAAGIHLVAATQTPRANVITGIIKANIPSRLAFKVASPLDSRVILDTNGAENLLGKGDFLFLPPGGITKMTRAQGAFVSDPEIAAIVKFCAAHAKQNFVQGVTAEMNNADGSGPAADNGGRLGGNGMSDEDAELYTRCVQLVITERKASTSLLQRRFSIGYGRAAKIMDMMEKRGVIGPASGNTSRPREVLVEAP